MEIEPDDRLKKEQGADRAAPARNDRAAEERAVTESRELTEDDRLRMFQNQLFNDALPDLPPFPGYHVCWLTTENPRDPVYRRLQMGYELIKADEVPGLQFATLKTGDYQGYIGVNEMVAAKLPLSLYTRFMEEVHHRAPAADEARLTEMADQQRGEAERLGAKLIEGDGNQELRKPPPAAGVFEA